MAKLEVDCVKLYEYGQFMIDKAVEFENLKTKMNSTLESISAWQGIDADVFKANAVEYFENLSQVKSAIDATGTQIQGISGMYMGKIKAFYDILG